MFLQLVAGGHLLLFITRNERWFFLPPFPAPLLFFAIVLTQVVAVLMCGFGWLVPSIPWTVIGWVWVYNIAWMFVLGAVRLIAETFATYRTARQARSMRIVNRAAGPAGRGVTGGSGMDYAKKFVVKPGSKVRLSKIDPSYTGKHESREEAAPAIAKHRRSAWRSSSTCSMPTATNPCSSCSRRSMRPARTAWCGTSSAA